MADDEAASAIWADGYVVRYISLRSRRVKERIAEKGKFRGKSDERSGQQAAGG
jgi:hypothetical protein